MENIELAAEYMGYFISSSIYCNLIIPALEENPTSSHLKIFAALLRGSPRELLIDELPRIGNLLQENHICQSRKFRYQMGILGCCQSLLNVCKEDCSVIFDSLFKAIFTTLALSMETMISEKSKVLLELLAKTENLESMDELYDKHIPSVLTEIQDAPESWTVSSNEFLIFQACITQARLTTYRSLRLIHPIFKKTTHADSDKKLQLKQFMSLSYYLQEWEKPVEEETAKAFINFANVILEKVIMPGLVWTAGHSAEAIRTASLCCLCTLLSKIVNNCENVDKIVLGKDDNNEKEKQFSISLEHFGWLFEKVKPILVGLMEDDAYKIRLYSLQAMCLVFNIGQALSYITEEHIHNISPDIVTRLEDTHDEVRLAAIEALREIWKVLPKDYDLPFYYVHIEYVYSKMLTHLDDPGQKFQQYAFGKKFVFYCNSLS